MPSVFRTRYQRLLHRLLECEVKRAAGVESSLTITVDECILWADQQVLQAAYADKTVRQWRSAMLAFATGRHLETLK